MDQYTATYENKYPETIKIGEYTIKLPDAPAEKDMINADKKRKERVWHRTRVPKGASSWSPEEADLFAKQQWHRRLNGEWWIIKDDPYYIPGPCIPFFDSWRTKNGQLAGFRYSALELFQFFYLVAEATPTAYGAFIVKPRRIGDSENFLYIVWERTTRFRNVRGGLQSFTDTEAGKNFSRIRTGHRGMPYYFKPNHTGSDNEALMMMPPSEIMTLKKLKEKAGNIAGNVSMEGSFLGSMIDYEATKTGKYDGDQLFTYFLDEAWKIPIHQMNVQEQWNNIKEVQSLFASTLIYGKSIISSTVENPKSKSSEVEAIDVFDYFWDNSNPNELKENGQTYTGLLRYFRDFELAAPLDHWGFPRRDVARANRTAELKAAKEKKDLVKIVSIKRKYPSSIKDARTRLKLKAPLSPDKCEERLRQIEEGEDWRGNKIKDYRPKVVEGFFRWVGGQPFTRVEWVPAAGGRFHMSQQPLRPNAVRWEYREVRDSHGAMITKKVPVPLNMPFYRSGLDPYDADNTIGGGSEGALVIKRREMLNMERKLKLDEHGKVLNVGDMETNTYVLDYIHRHVDPELFYMDCLMALWYFGVASFVEYDKPGFVNWANRNFLTAFLQYEPPQLLQGARKKARVGSKATGHVVSTYVDALAAYVPTYIWNNHHPRIIEQWKEFEPKERTKYDLAVATGFAEIGDFDNRYTQEASENSRGWKNDIR
jgi:hypothetical protein